MSVILEYLSAVDPDHVMYAILAGIMIFCVIAMSKLNADERSPINVMDLITENDKLSESKLIRFFTWVVSTWGFIYLIADHKLTEWYFIGYMGAWVANALIDNRSNASKYRSQTTYEDREDK
jgi:hypothetical protein